jgi:protein ATS1
VYKIGDNRKGQLGSQVQRSQVSEFTKAPFPVNFVAAACESSAYIFTHGDAAKSQAITEGSGQWGEVFPELEYGHDSASVKSVVLPGTVIDFAAGVWHYVAIMEDGSVYGWGKARLGQLGDNLTGKVTTPTKLDIPFKPAKVVCGKDFTYLVGDASTGNHILLGKDKFNIISNMPADIKDWKDIGATWHAIFVLFNNGSLTAWGKENMWKLLPSDLPRKLP